MRGLAIFGLYTVWTIALIAIGHWAFSYYPAGTQMVDASKCLIRAHDEGLPVSGPSSFEFTGLVASKAIQIKQLWLIGKTEGRSAEIVCLIRGDEVYHLTNPAGGTFLSN